MFCVKYIRYDYYQGNTKKYFVLSLIPKWIMFTFYMKNPEVFTSYYSHIIFNISLHMFVSGYCHDFFYYLWMLCFLLLYDQSNF